MNDERNEAERKGDYDTPRPLDNRAGLDTLRYRVGSFASFRRTMLRNIPRVQVKTREDATSAPLRNWSARDSDDFGIQAPLRNWSARDSDDYGIALIELWAYIADILTFYQERIANEAFIRTARHRDSLVRLANLLDYKPASGMAASVFLVFQMKDGTSARIRKQFPVQHVPVGEEKPQTFETSGELIADAVWNELTPLPDRPRNVTFRIDDTETRLKGAKARIAVGDWVLIIGKKRATADPGSDEAGSEGYEIRQVVEVERLPDVDETRIIFDEPLGVRIWGNEVVVETVADLYVFRGRGALFGHNAPEWRTLGALAAYEYLPAAARKVSTSLAPGPYLIQVTEKVRAQGDFPNQELRLGVRTLDLDRVYKKVVKDGWIAMVNGGYREAYKVTNVETVSRADYTRSAQVSRLKVDTDENFEKYGLDKTKKEKKRRNKDNSFQRVRGTTVLLNAEQLPLAQDIDPTFLSGDQIDVVEDVSLLKKGHLLMVFGETIAKEKSDGIKGEVAIVRDTDKIETQKTDDAVKETQSAFYYRIFLEKGLDYEYVRADTRIFANVAAATHGETMTEEILGNGDASISFQRFELKQSPLTYLPQAGVANGAAPAMELRVNGVRWENVPSFYGRAGDEAIFTIDITDEQDTIIRTGDGKTGARPGTGPNNISATYRKGIGKAGIVGAGTIKTPLERPKGLKKVFNPMASSGGAEREDPESIRRNAPNTVRTFGRIVSLRDFEDAAREYIGISKARAFIAWDDEWQTVNLVVAGDDGNKVVGESLKALVDDLNSRRDPNRKLNVGNCDTVNVALTLEIHPDPAYLGNIVKANVTAEIERFFAFDHLDLGQSISLSEIYRVVHSAEGVIGANIKRFHSSDPEQNNNDEKVDAPTEEIVKDVLVDILTIESHQIAQLNTGASDAYIIDIAGEGDHA